MKGKLIGLFAALLPFAAFAQTEQVSIQRIEAMQQVVANRVRGVEIRFESVYTGPVNALFKEGQLAVYLVDANGSYLRARPGSGEAYTDAQGNFRVFATIDLSKSPATSLQQVFLPFHALELPEGAHMLKVRVRIKRNLREAAEVLNAYDEREGNFRYEMPRMYRVQLGVAEAEVEATDAAGTTWDTPIRVGSNDRQLPDLAWQIRLESLRLQSISYQSEERRNTLTGTWTGVSPVVYLSELDEIGLYVVDVEDIGEPQLIGGLFFTAGQLRQLQEEPEEMHFGRVKRLKFSSIRVE